MSSDEQVTDDRRRRIHAMDTSERTPVFLLEGRNGRTMRLSQTAARVFEMRWDGASYEAIAVELLELGYTTTPAEVAAYHEALRLRLAEIESRPGKLDRSHWLRFPVLPAKAVAIAAGPLARCYSACFAVSALSFAALTLAVAIRRGLSPHGIVGWDLPLAYLLYFVSVLVHELGHASALLAYRRQPGAIGFTLYLTFPALYSDVTDAWALKRWQRVVVDVAGSYWQLVWTGLYAFAYDLTGWPALRAAILIVLMTTAFNLNPVLKMDGYWIVADALGVTNLARQPRRLAGVVYHALLRRTLPVSARLPWSTGTVAVLAVYSVASVVIWSFFVYGLAKGIFAQLAFSVHLVQAVLRHSVAITATTAVQLLFLVVGLLVSAIVCYRLVVTFVRSGVKLASRRPTTPR